MDDFQKEMFDIFVFETNSFLAQLETILMQEENQDSNILDSVPEIFRIMHTLKSSSAMMDMPHISKLAHSVEDLFFYIRENAPPQLNKKKLTDIVFTCVDYIKNNMTTEDPADPSTTIAEVMDYLKQLQSGGDTATPEVQGPCALRVLFQPNCAMIGLRAFEIITRVQRIQEIASYEPLEDAPSADITLQSTGLLFTFASGENLKAIIQQIEASPFVASVQSADLPAAKPAADLGPAALVSAPDPAEAPAAAPVLAAPGAANAAPPPDGRNYAERRRTPRNDGNYLAIDISKLDHLINLVGELIIASMGATHAFESDTHEQRRLALENLQRLIADVQDHALSLRMVAVTDMFHKLNRSVRDATSKLDRQVEFSMAGEQTALDRKVIDHVFAPLMHILRNSIDHGIESPAEREAVGKPPAGQVQLSAAIDGNQAVLCVTDDGRGIDRDEVLAKAIDGNLVTEEQAQKLSDEDIFAFLFLPGFSTKRDVTELSGRGVGMNVVSDSVRKLNGRIAISSQVGKGTKMEIRIPLTLAILEALILQMGQEVCALAISVVKEAFKPSLESIRQANGEDVVLHRDACYQIVRLGDIFGIPHTGYAHGMMLLVDANGEQYALYVDNALDQQSIVVKPIPPLLKRIRGIFGCTILGNGKVCLIIDAVSLWTKAKG